MIRRIALALVLLAASGLPAGAHAPSDSRLALRLDAGRVEGRWEIALRDLDFVLALDADGDGVLTWGEVRARLGEIDDLALAALRLSVGETPCTLRIGAAMVDRRGEIGQLVLPLAGECPTPVDRLSLDYRLFAEVDPRHAGLIRVSVDGADHALVLGADHPRATLAFTAAGRLREVADFVATGVVHIWTGLDHLLFLVSLLLPSVIERRDGRAVGRAGLRAAGMEILRIVTAFTLAHSLTLSLAALGVVAVPARLTESVIALSVVVAALNNLHPVVERRLWAAAFLFGLVHGFGFASALTELDLPRTTLVWALAGFNLGVEIGQAALVVLLLPIAWYCRNRAFYHRSVLRGGSAAIAAVAALWFAERAFDLALIPSLP